MIGEVDGRPDTVTLNELTTVASVWTNAQFLRGSAIVGNGTGIYNAASNVENIVDIETGRPGPVIGNAAHSSPAGALASADTLGNIVHACAVLSTADACERLFSAAAPPGRNAPANTLRRAPQHSLEPVEQRHGNLLAQSRKQSLLPRARFSPVRLDYRAQIHGRGAGLAGAIAIDADGNVWVTNGLLTGADDCPDGGAGVTKLTPDGFPLSPPYGFTGRGHGRRGLRITIDQTGNVWIGNKRGGSVSLLTPEGSPISPEGTGYKANGNTSRVQGTIADYDGNYGSSTTNTPTNARMREFPHIIPGRRSG